VYSPYRGRLAPSPTGYLHAGHAATFWAAYQRARDVRGVLVFRMEDLDIYRSREQYASAVYEDLRWLGIDWQEGPDVGGAHGPYLQSQRRQLYLAAWRRLLELRAIYPCRCSRKDLARIASAPHEAGVAPLDDEPVYPGTCRENLGDPERPEGFNWRFRVPNGENVDFLDGHCGRQSFVAGKDFGDFLVWRRDDVPAYQLACVVDDAAMQITEVVRGADLLKSTARQILLNRALGFSIPLWFHCDLLTDESGQRLAKRHDALSLRTLRERGFTPRDILTSSSKCQTLPNP
jgi:glutamyl/glutaminyl-tRNA synthetase